MREEFPAPIDGYNYIALGPGTSGALAIRWFLTAPATNACAARYWLKGDLYAPQEIMLGVCDLPGTSGCAPGSVNAFACIGSACSSNEPGSSSNWQVNWVLTQTC